MTTIIERTSGSDASSSMATMLIAIVAIVAIVGFGLFFLRVFPFNNTGNNPGAIDVNVDMPGSNQ